MAESYGMKFFETSAKEGTNVRDSFAALARDVVMEMVSSGTLQAPVAVAGAGAAPKKKDCAIM